MTRSEHISWCKRRALEHLDRGDVQNGVISMMSDLEKHPDTQGTGGAMAGLSLIAMQGDVEYARKFIKGFN